MTWHFHGCSISTDEFVVNKQDAYPNLVGDYFDKVVEIKACPGNSNQIIFNEAIGSLLDPTCDVVFLQVTSPGRETFYQGINNKSNTLGKSHYEIPDSKWKTFISIYKMLDQEYNQYVLLSVLIPKITKIAELTGKKLYFLNGLLYFDPIFFNKDQNINYMTVNEYTRKYLLDFDNSSDENMALYINDVRNKLACIDQTKWITLCESLYDLTVDYGIDGAHPGAKSNEKYAKLIIDFIEMNNG